MNATIHLTDIDIAKQCLRWKVSYEFFNATGEPVHAGREHIKSTRNNAWDDELTLIYSVDEVFEELGFVRQLGKFGINQDNQADMWLFEIPRERLTAEGSAGEIEFSKPFQLKLKGEPVSSVEWVIKPVLRFGFWEFMLKGVSE